jgi:hypothetical protein
MKRTNDVFQEDDIREREREIDFVTSRQCFDIHSRVFVIGYQRHSGTKASEIYKISF